MRYMETSCLLLEVVIFQLPNPF